MSAWAVSTRNVIVLSGGPEYRSHSEGEETGVEKIFLNGSASSIKAIVQKQCSDPSFPGTSRSSVRPVIRGRAPAKAITLNDPQSSYATTRQREEGRCKVIRKSWRFTDAAIAAMRKTREMDQDQSTRSIRHENGS